MTRDKWTQGASLEASDKDSSVSGGGITVNTPWVWGCSGSLGMVLAVRAQNNPGQFSRRRRGEVGYLGPCPLYTGPIHRIVGPRSMTETHPSPKASGEGSSIYPLFAKSGVSNFLQESSISPWDFDIWEPQSVQPNTYVFIKFSRYAHFTFPHLCQSAHQKQRTDLYCLFLMPYIEYLSLSTCFEGNPISQRLVYLIYPSKVLVLGLINQFHRLFALWLM